MILEHLFHLKENNTTVFTEIIAGITIFFTMAYVLAVNPMILGDTGAGMPSGAVYLATILATAIGCLLLGLFANVPLAQTAVLGINTFFAETVVLLLGFTWKEALSIVFICGILNLIITLTNLRKTLISCIPKPLKAAIGGGLGLFIAYNGLINSKLIEIDHSIPSINWTGISADPSIWLFIISLTITLILMVRKVKGAFIISIIATTLIGLIPIFGVTNLSSSISITDAFEQLPTTLGVVFTPDGIISLFSEAERIPLIIILILTFSLIDILDTIGTVISVGQKINLDSDDTLLQNHHHKKIFSTKNERVLTADALAIPVGAIFGTSNISVGIESAAGIEIGGRTGLTAVVTAICFLLCIFITPLATIVPSVATTPIMIAIGILMIKTIVEINWDKLDTAIPCFFTVIFMALSKSIPDGIAFGFISYCLIKIIKHETKEVPPTLWIISLFFLNYILLITFITGILVNTG